MKTYNSKEMQRLAHVTPTQIVRWSDLGIIKPYRDQKGRGKSRLYNHQNLIEALICKELAQWRMETDVMHQVTEQLRRKISRFEDKKKKSAIWEDLETLEYDGSQPLFLAIYRSAEGNEVRTRLETKNEINAHSMGFRSCIVINLGLIFNEVGPF